MDVVPRAVILVAEADLFFSKTVLIQGSQEGRNRTKKR